MKRFIFLVPAMVIIGCGGAKSEDVSSVAVAPGIYAGRIACVFCPQTATVLHLNSDGTFAWQDSLSEGNRWESGNGVLLRTAKGENLQLIAESDKLRTVVAKKPGVRRDYYLQKFPDVFGKTWTLVTLGQSHINADDARRPTLILSATNLRAAGNGGCNAYSGGFALSQGHGIAFGPIAATKMFCHQALYEADFLRMLELTDRLQLQSDTLVLYGQRKPLARFVSG